MRAARSTPAGEFPARITPAANGKTSGLIQAVREGDVPGVKRRLKQTLFKKPEDVNSRDDRADILAEDRHGWSVLHYAVRYGTEAMLAFLLENGADLHHREKRGWNLLHIAARNGMADKARLLLEHEIDVHAVQAQGWNSLHLAVRYGQPDTISTLLEYGIRINAHNRGWTALQLAALNGHTDIASILINKGADLSVVNGDGQTALDIAREEGHDRIVAFIMEAEFQGAAGTEQLPSPPPTPPSAPPASELVQDEEQDAILINGDASHTGAVVGTIDRWRIQLQQDLEDVSNEDITSESDEDRNNVEVRIGWKSFEEEKRELLQQLERVRLKEITRIEDDKKKRKEKFQTYCIKVDRQVGIIKEQIDQLTSQQIPNAQESGRMKYQTLKEDITQISALIENAKVETELIDTLQNHQIHNDFATAGLRKRDLLRQLAAAQLDEREELEALKRAKYDEMEHFEVWAQAEVAKVERKVKILEEELKAVAADKVRREKQFKESLTQLEDELQKAERQRLISQEEEEDKLACPVCLELLKPPLRIFQCPEGHILCENCKENPALVHCPQCRISLESNVSRNRALEEVARGYFAATD